MKFLFYPKNKFIYDYCWGCKNTNYRSYHYAPVFSRDIPSTIHICDREECVRRFVEEYTIYFALFDTDILVADHFMVFMNDPDQTFSYIDQNQESWFCVATSYRMDTLILYKSLDLFTISERVSCDDPIVLSEIKKKRDRVISQYLEMVISHCPKIQNEYHEKNTQKKYMEKVLDELHWMPSTKTFGGGMYFLESKQKNKSFMKPVFDEILFMPPNEPYFQGGIEYHHAKREFYEKIIAVV
jgi:hypothetical protein